MVSILSMCTDGAGKAGVGVGKIIGCASSAGISSIREVQIPDSDSFGAKLSATVLLPPSLPAAAAAISSEASRTLVLAPPSGG